MARQMSVGGVPVEELPKETLERLGIKVPDEEKLPKMVKPQVIAMGGVLQSLKGLTNREALWVLRTSTILVRGYRKEKEPKLGKERNARTNRAWRGTTIVK
ncbi:hypothetical protein ES703_31186 [subsurface metagenome]